MIGTETGLRTTALSMMRIAVLMHCPVRLRRYEQPRPGGTRRAPVGVSANGSDRQSPKRSGRAGSCAAGPSLRSGAATMTAISNSDMLITIFGASGFLGRHVVRALAGHGYRMRAAVRRSDLAGPLQPLDRTTLDRGDRPVLFVALPQGRAVPPARLTSAGIGGGTGARTSMT